MIWLRALLVWCLIVLVETLHGAVRQWLLVPQFGELWSRQLGVVTGSLLIFLVCWLCIDWIGARSKRQLFAIGVAWVLLMLAFEFSLGLALGYSYERMLSDYRIDEGGLMSFGLLWLMLAPLVTARLRATTRTKTRDTRLF